MKGVGRGPEYSSINNVGQHVIFGFHRLAINGLNPTSHQPIQNDNISLICNGEIYNYHELYRQLHITPNTQSDCEVIIHLYKRFGMERTLQLLDGVFAFVLLDYDIHSETSKIFVARDPFGVRPLYFLHPLSENSAEQQIYGFASELKCLNEFHRNIQDYEIQHVLPGTYSTFEKQFTVSASWKLTKESQRYHIPSVITTQYGMVDYDYESELNHWIPILQSQLVRSVEKRCTTTERPIACLLSGGLDSSLITALIIINVRDYPH
jgi:asparagine synthase (glutamine-hydrolysing)